jgi:UDP-N-acetyl-D-mannosaminuronic acid dehydrogenase
MIAKQAGADFDKVYHAMTYKYDRARTFPRPGFAAGPCLLKDTMQIAAFSYNDFPLGRAAMTINEGLPQLIISELATRFDLSTKTVGILGMAFKADIDDIRDSLSYKIGKLLRFHGATVMYSDEFAKDPTFSTKEDLVAKSDIIILATPHSAYRSLKIPKGKHLVDIWGFFGHTT